MKPGLLCRHTACLALALTMGFGPLAQAAEAVPPIVAEVRARMADDAVLRGEFEQRKTLKGFKNPIVSRGDFLVSRERGVVWRTREPFASSLTITRDRLVTRAADGAVTSRTDARDEPGMQMVNEMLFALLSADLRTLSQRFAIEGETRGKDGWRLVLVPRDAATAQAVTRIELEGDRYLKNVRLVEAQGDSNLIRFSQQAASAALTSDEARRFD
jgi:hypothetical protein